MSRSLAEVYQAINNFEQENGESFFDSIDGMCTSVDTVSVAFMNWLSKRPNDYKIVVDFMKEFYEDSYRLDNQEELESEQELMKCIRTVGVSLYPFLWEGIKCHVYAPSYLQKYDYLKPFIPYYTMTFDLLYCFLIEFLLETDNNSIIEEWFDFLQNN